MRQPGIEPGSIAAIIIDNNDGSPGLLQNVSISDSYIEGKIAIDNGTGPVQIVDSRMINSFISVEGTTDQDIRIDGGFIN